MDTNQTNQQQLFDTFLDNTPLKTKGILMVKKDDQDNEIVTAVLSADSILFRQLKSSTISTMQENMNENIPMSIDTIDFMRAGIAKLCDKKHIGSVKLNDIFSSVALFTKGESVRPTPEFNLPVLVFSNSPMEINRFTKDIIDHHLSLQTWTNNVGKRTSGIAHKIVELNADIAINDNPITRVTIDTLEKAQDTMVSVQEGHETDPISVAINNILDKSSEIQTM